MGFQLSSSASETKYLITDSTNGTGDTRKQIVEVQVDGRPVQAEQAPACSREEKMSLYDLERQYDKKGLTDAERGDERQGLKTKEILISLRQHLDIEKGKDPPYLMAATYHSIISTMKMQGWSAWEYLGKFFTKSLVKRRASSLLERLSVKT